MNLIVVNKEDLKKLITLIELFGVENESVLLELNELF